MDYKADFNACPLGPFTNANKRLAWGAANVSYDDDQNGKFKEIVEDPLHGRACRHLYPANEAGAAGKQYQLQLAPTDKPVILEYDVLVEGGFDMSAGGGKFPPMICWGKFSGSSAGVVTMMWWSNPGSQPPESFWAVLQNQPDGKQFIAATPNGPMRGPTIARDTWYHIRLEMLGGPQGYSRYTLNDGSALDFTHTGQVGNTALSDEVIINISGFYGGGPGSAPPSNGFMRVANMRVHNDTKAENGASFTIDIDGKRYLVTGQWKLHLQE